MESLETANTKWSCVSYVSYGKISSERIGPRFIECVLPLNTKMYYGDHGPWTYQQCPI